jgi:hypothetical protein
MAMEAEELERGESARGEDVARPPHLRLVGVGDDQDVDLPARSRRWWVAGGMLAAAGVALASLLPMMIKPAAPGGPAGHGHEVASGGAGPEMRPVEPPKFRRHQDLEALAQGGTTVVFPLNEYELSERAMCVPPRMSVAMGHAVDSDRVDPGTVQQCVVIGIFRDDHGAMCVKVRPQEWAGNKCLSEVTPQELRTVSLGQACTPVVSRTLVVAMAGPQRSLPKTEWEAAGVAQCIVGGVDTRHAGLDDVRSYMNAAASCVSPEVAVKVEAVANR